MLELSHKKLIAWQKAIQLLPLVYAVCKKLPKEEAYNIVSQVKRAGLSVSNNLAEGHPVKRSRIRSVFLKFQDHLLWKLTIA